MSRDGISEPAARARIRVALEGCGHGKLHDIYSKVTETAASKGWDGVDLLIIGGDFQSVRNANDLTGMSVPVKYREIGDFHEYYSGKRTAPYLTIFIGGNHEASNYLFELYYGGWVAPNIYYLGAANVIRYGPLRIAGLSGIWKGYDYRKPHYERLPYNNDEVKSIYHVRELDVRKLLQIRTQVDVGLSHDWPRDAEKFGDYQHLFRIKRGFREDSESGKLGNVAAKQIMDRLRPRHWFSAHLHVRYIATIPHGEYPYPHNAESTKTAKKITHQSFPQGFDGATISTPSEMLGTVNDEDQEMGGVSLEVADTVSDPLCQIKGFTAATNEANAHLAWNNFHEVAAKQEALDRENFLQNQPQPGESYKLGVDFTQTWRKVESNGIRRKVTDVHTTDLGEEKKTVKNTNEIDLDFDSDIEAPGIQKKEASEQTITVKNSDEIDLDSNSDSEEVKKSNNLTNTDTSMKDSDEIKPDHNVETATGSSFLMAQTAASTKLMGGKRASEYVSENLRDELPDAFKRLRPEPAVYGPLPDAITNKTTEFLALGKCQDGFACSEYLELMEIVPISEESSAQASYILEYDKEWLAITRVFADSIELGDHRSQVPSDLGDEVYKPKILAEESWVEENIVNKGKMAVPNNFEITAPVYDPAVSINTKDMPPEYNNPQTAAFCELLGIENKFHLTPEEQVRRAALEPRPSSSYNHGQRQGSYRQGRHVSGRGGRWRGSRGRGFSR
ncbi:lariat debranching enzyme, C-terminal domain-containing protein [Talaromyces proteolyticus]|uniref:Lariat debranching enzyme, C-terminal domain-containing protein n=1 Tax=Talaromyces proteolyticus TaxID=1131652 RepID=A0AAD4KPF4_9EURO|nr:lariat debranching enzyme, C-terminal domain-containing protein [Talaromyces proteolyticus]KAH8696340.1 lariat debranching enzyme, C-terminal domain-containing protein [Talaromyces proteolyticus]